MKFRSLLPGGTRAFGPGGHPDPAELTGGKLPHVLNPLLLPPEIGPEIF